MDVFLPALIGSLPSMGIYGAIGWVLILLLRREATAEERWARELDRIRKAHDEELNELHQDVERERKARRVVEDELRAYLRSQSHDRS